MSVTSDGQRGASSRERQSPSGLTCPDVRRSSEKLSVTDRAFFASRVRFL